MRERFELFCSSMFGHYFSEKHIILKTDSHSSNSDFKFSKLRFILRILACRTLSSCKYCVLRKYCFTSFCLKYKVSKLDLVISSKKFVSGSLSSNVVRESVL